MVMREVRVVNRTKESDLGGHIAVADSFLTRFLGLMGRTSLPVGQGLLLLPSSGVHTFWMRMPIDILGLGHDNHVIQLAESVKPWRISFQDRHVRSVLELPSGQIAATRTAIGDRLSIEPTRIA